MLTDVSNHTFAIGATYPMLLGRFLVLRGSDLPPGHQPRARELEGPLLAMAVVTRTERIP